MGKREQVHRAHRRLKINKKVPMGQNSREEECVYIYMYVSYINVYLSVDLAWFICVLYSKYVKSSAWMSYLFSFVVQPRAMVVDCGFFETSGASLTADGEVLCMCLGNFF